MKTPINTNLRDFKSGLNVRITFSMLREVAFSILLSQVECVSIKISIEIHACADFIMKP